MKSGTVPLCSYFGRCGGCAHQNLSYDDELALKEKNLRGLLQDELGLAEEIFHPIVSSPNFYFYRSRLDLSFQRMQGKLELGFNGEGTRRLIPIDSCAIARPEINTFLPNLKKLAAERLPENYRNANLVVKTDDTGQIRWGGIGRRSLRMPESDYFWTEIEGRKIFYSLESFFQANLGILPEFIERLRSLLDLTPETCLLDLYAGVGLFWVLFAREVFEVWAVEESSSSVRVAEFNRSFHGFSNVILKEGKTEECLAEILEELKERPQVAIVDPPRKGLSEAALEKLAKARTIRRLIYISCHPPSLARDLKGFIEAGWQVDAIIPFDFFPRTRHLETLVRLGI